MDATELLQKDHDKVRELFRQYRGGGGITGLVKRVTGNVSEDQRRAAVDKVCAALDLHAMIEEEIFYPALRALNDEELSRQVAEGIREHGTVKEQVAALRRTEGVGDDVDQHMTKLEECVEHHAGEEEREMLPRVRELMPDQAREVLGRQLQARKRGAGTTATKARRAPARRAGKAAAAKSRSARLRSAKINKTSQKRRVVGRARATTAKKAKAPKRARSGRRR